MLELERLEVHPGVERTGSSLCTLVVQSDLRRVLVECEAENLVLFCCASRQWRCGACRRNHNTTSAGLSVLWAQHLPRRALGECLLLT